MYRLVVLLPVSGIRVYYALITYNIRCRDDIKLCTCCCSCRLLTCGSVQDGRRTKVLLADAGSSHVALHVGFEDVLRIN